MATALHLESLSKHFGGVRALSDVSLRLESGQVLGLIGENGAGKSTLIKILNGVHRADGGSILLDGREVSFGSPAEALRAGVATVHQESSLVPNLDVAANLMLAHESASGNGSLLVSRRSTHKAARVLMDKTGFDIALDTPAAELSVAQRQLVEIARALAMAATVLILDEPTAALSPDEVEVLFGAIRDIRDQGVPVDLRLTPSRGDPAHLRSRGGVAQWNARRRARGCRGDARSPGAADAWPRCQGALPGP